MNQFLEVFNLANILFTSIFTALGALLGYAVSKNNDVKDNHTKLIVTKQIIEERRIIYDRKIKVEPSVGNYNSNKNDSNDSIIVLAVLAFIIASVYAKYHNEVIQGLIIETTMLTLGSISFVIVLSICNSFDRLSRYWFSISILVSIINCITIVLIMNQNVSTDNGLMDLARILYYFLGILFIAIINLMMISIQLYMISFNIFIKWQNTITYKAMKFLDNLFGNTRGVTITIIILSVVSILFSSGILYEFISNGTNANLTYLEVSVFDIC